MTTTTDVPRPVPAMPDSPLYRAYFAGLREQAIRVPRCTDCGVLQWPPRELCGHCQGSSFEQVDVPTVGEVYTYTVMNRAFHPWFRDKVPYGAAVVEVAPGVRILGRYAGDDVESLHCGQRMVAVFDDLGADSGSIAWRPARATR